TKQLLIVHTMEDKFDGNFINYLSNDKLLILSLNINNLCRPIVSLVVEHTKMNWRLSSTLDFLILVILLLVLLTGAGLAIAQQLAGLVRVVQEFTNNLPQLADNLSAFLSKYGVIGDLINLNDLANRILQALQPLLGQAGSIVGSVATGAAVSFGRIVFVLIVAYFILSESGQVGELQIDQIPQYDYDIRRMGRQLRKIWDSFFRGQLIIFLMVFVVYLIVLSALGVRYSLALAALTGLAIFIPYVGLWTTAIVMVLVTFFQPGNYFGLQPWQYSVMVLAIALVINFIFDNYISPRFLGRTLDIHPAAVLVAALFMASLFGLVGIFLAAPIVTTVKAVGVYVFRKMFDLDPWPAAEVAAKPVEFPWKSWYRGVQDWVERIRKKRKQDQE
ncbi:MAG: AI-2E family transporter, partial [Anaerolineales bacterium]